MDLMSIMGALMGSPSTSGISQATGASTNDVTSILASALPSLLSGANRQATQTSTATSFAKALSSHAQDDTSNLAAFYNNVDLNDGAKIIQHLFGNQTNSITRSVASQAGVTQKQALSVLSAAAPLLMSLLGKQAAQAVQPKPQGSQPSGGASAGAGLLASLIGGAQQQAPAQQSGIGGLLGNLFGGGAQQQSADSNPLGSMVGNMLGSADVSSLLSGFLGSGK